MAEWIFRLRAKLDDRGKVSKMAVEEMAKWGDSWETQERGEDGRFGGGGGGASGSQHDAHGNPVDLHGGAGGGHGINEALAPQRSWSPGMAGATRTAMEQANGKDGALLGETLQKFQDKGSIGALRSGIDAQVSGTPKEGLAGDRARVLLDGIRQSNPTTKELYRGMSVKGGVGYQPGQKINMNLTSFTSDRKQSDRFIKMTSGPGTSRVRVVLDPGARALPIQNLTKDHRLFQERESVTSGTFEVKSVATNSGTTIVHVAQTGTF